MFSPPQGHSTKQGDSCKHTNTVTDPFSLPYLYSDPPYTRTNNMWPTSTLPPYIYIYISHKSPDVLAVIAIKHSLSNQLLIYLSISFISFEILHIGHAHFLNPFCGQRMYTHAVSILGMHCSPKGKTPFSHFHNVPPPLVMFHFCTSNCLFSKR